MDDIMETTTHDTSVLASLREKRRNAAANLTTDMPIPGYAGELVVRYRLLDPLVEGKTIGDRVQAQFSAAGLESERVYYGLVDGLIAACVAIFAKVGDELVPLAGEGTVTTYEDTDDLAELLGFTPAATTRATVVEVFGGSEHKIAVSGHAIRVQRWMSDPSGELNQGLA
jgi:hypothetical protein